MVSALKDLQDVLGRFQDRAVQVERCAACATSSPPSRAGPAALLALGPALDALLADQRGRARGVRRAFARLRRREQRRPCGTRSRRRVKVVATYSIKGGVGKTSAAVNLGALAARDGLRTVIWDLDPQGAASFLFRVKPKVKGGGRG